MSEKKKKKKKPYRGFWIFVRIQIFLMLLVLGGVGYYYVGGYAEQVQSLRAEAIQFVKATTADTFRNNETSLCYDTDGELISELIGEKDVYYSTFDEIPQTVYDIFVCTEDKKFYKHPGYDLKGILRAAWAALRNGEITQGGSTITQQLARMTYLSNERTWQRKAEEIFIAVELEKKFSKIQILEFYVNNVYFANGYYGIEAASQGYFGVSAKKLSLSQTAFLCAIPNSPTRYDPLVNFDATIERRNLILYQLFTDGYISAIDYEKALAEEITLTQDTRVKNNYVETYTYYCAIRALMAQDGFVFQTTFATDADREAYESSYEELYAEYQKKLYTEGYRIYTSIDLTAQNELQTILNEELDTYYTTTDENGIYELQGSAVCIDNKTGLVVAIVGGREQNLPGYTLNRAYQSFRQPGSAIKPLIVYTPWLERGYTPDTAVMDEPVLVDPENEESGYVSNVEGEYWGEITLREAVMWSKNTIAWKLFGDLTPEVGLQYLLNMHFSHISVEDYRLPTAIGGMTYGVSALEMASAYATIENDGYYRNPSCIVKITDAEGNLIYENDGSMEQIYGTNACRMMTSMMETVMTDGTGKGYGLENMTSAGKTGTTNSSKDVWMVGYTYYYTTAVWVGYDMPKAIENISEYACHKKIWHDFMVYMHEGLDEIRFQDYYLYTPSEETEEGTEGTSGEDASVEEAASTAEEPASAAEETAPAGAETTTDTTETTPVQEETAQATQEPSAAGEDTSAATAE